MYFLSMKLGCFCYFNVLVIMCLTHRIKEGKVYLFIPIPEDEARPGRRGSNFCSGKTLKGQFLTHKEIYTFKFGVKDVVSVSTYKMFFACRFPMAFFVQNVVF